MSRWPTPLVWPCTSCSTGSPRASGSLSFSTTASASSSRRLRRSWTPRRRPRASWPPGARAKLTQPRLEGRPADWDVVDAFILKTALGPPLRSAAPGPDTRASADAASAYRHEREYEVVCLRPACDATGPLEVHRRLVVRAGTPAAGTCSGMADVQARTGLKGRRSGSAAGSRAGGDLRWSWAAGDVPPGRPGVAQQHVRRCGDASYPSCAASRTLLYPLVSRSYPQVIGVRRRAGYGSGDRAMSAVECRPPRRH